VKNRSDECKKFLDVLEKFHDNELSEDIYNETAEHLKMCNKCAAELEKIKEVDKLVSEKIYSIPPQKFWDDQRNIIMDNIVEKPERESRGIWKIGLSLAAAATVTFFVVNRIDNNEPVTVSIPEISNTIITSDENQVKNTTEAVKEVPQSTTENVPAKKPENVIAENIIADEPVKIKTSNSETKQANVVEKTDETELGLQLKPNRSSNSSVIITGAVKRSMFTALTEKFEDWDEEFDNRVTNQKASAVELFSKRELIRVGGSTTFAFVLPTEENLPKNAEEEYTGYLDNKRVIDKLENNIDRKNGWLRYLAVVEEKVVFDLILDDLYHLYDMIVTPGSNKELKKEALDYMIAFEKFLSEKMSEKVYISKLDYYRSIQ